MPQPAPALLRCRPVAAKTIGHEPHRRRGDIGWQTIEYAQQEIVQLASVGLQIPMRDVYEGVPIESLAQGPGQG